MPGSLALNMASWQDAKPGPFKTSAPVEASDVEERGKLTFVPAPSDLPTMRWGSGVVNLSAAPQLLLGAPGPPGTAAEQPPPPDLVSPGERTSFGVQGRGILSPWGHEGQGGKIA